MKSKRKSVFVQTGYKWLLRFLITFFVTTICAVASLRWIDPFTSSFMLQYQSHENRAIDYQWLPRQQISSHLAIAAVASEDQKFPVHHGFDFSSIYSAIQDSTKGKSLRGASTISQQVSKNLFLWKGRSFVRKGLEAYFTVLLELFLPKDRILEIYLNIAEFGPGIYGVGAASKRYFKLHARELSLYQSCQLITALPNPKRIKVVPASDYVKKRTSEIVTQVKQLGGIEYLKRS